MNTSWKNHQGNAARCYQIANGKAGAASTAVRVNACRLLQKWGEFTPEDVADMLSWTRRFLEEHCA